MNRDYDYVTLYLPYEGQLTRSPASQLISMEAQKWLNDHVGPGTLSERDWILEAMKNKYQWCYAGIRHSPESHFTEVTRVFYIRDITKALMFKLVWGG